MFSRSQKPRARSQEPRVERPEPEAKSLELGAQSSSQRAYIDGLKLLGRRELSEAQVRQRLTRKGHDLESVDAAVARLREERAINDERVAEAIAHTALAVRGHGKLRIKRQIEQAGIAAVTARGAIDRVFEDVNDDSLIEASIGKRLRGRDRLKDDAEFRRVYRYLIGQGFESDRVVAALKRRRARNAPDDDHEPSA